MTADLPEHGYSPVPSYEPGRPPTQQQPARLQRPWRAANVGLGYAVLALSGLSVLEDIRIIAYDYALKGYLADGDIEAIVEAGETQAPYDVVTGILAVASVIVYLLWQHRIWTSDRSNPLAHTRSPAFAIGSWFIPVANIVLAPLALRDLWWGAATARPASPPLQAGPRPRFPMPRLVLVWMVLLVAAIGLSIAGSLDLSAAADATTGGGLSASFDRGLTLEMVGILFSVASTVAFCLYVLQIQSFTRR